MQIAVLTGYRDFNYAQEAIKLGVTRFLLKPSKMDELHEALSAMKERLDKLPPDAAAGEDEPCLDRHAGSFIVNQATAYIEEHYAQKLTLQEVADKCYVSQWHLSKLINKYTGNTFYELLNNVRIEKAKALLNDPKLKIGDIVDMVGYSDAAHFSRVFKRIVGVSANEYRNSSAVK